MIWQEEAACLGEDNSWWFPPPHTGRNPNTIKAKKICASCPVKQECLEFACSESIQHGIFGGMNYKERLNYQSGRPPKTRTRLQFTACMFPDERKLYGPNAGDPVCGEHAGYRRGCRAEPCFLAETDRRAVYYERERERRRVYLRDWRKRKKEEDMKDAA